MYTLLSLIFSLSSVVSLNQSERYMAYVDSADNCIATSQWHDAERYLVKALQTDPANQGNMLLLSNLGTVRTQLGNIPGALQAFDIALARAPKSTALLTNRALAYLTFGDNKAALADLDNALSIDSLLPRALETRGMLLLEKGETEKATIDFSTLSKLSPQNAAAWAGMGQCSAANGIYLEAANYFAKAVTLDTDETYNYLYVLSLIQAKRYLDATDAVRKALTTFPESGRLYLLRSILYRIHHQLSEADAAKALAKRYGFEPTLEKELMQTISP